MLAKANFNPGQPRHPRGQPEGGQWTRTPGGGLPEGTAHLADGTVIRVTRGKADEAAALIRRGDYPSAQTYGTAVHKRVKDVVAGLQDAKLVAERSFFKEQADVRVDAVYGRVGTVRIDVYEDAGDGVICIYDLKTGRAAPDPFRALELARTAYYNFRRVRRILLIELRPGE